MAGTRRSISVAIASYNGGPYIVEQLASIAGQSVLADEVILSDDGSSDDTCALAGAFGENAPFAMRLLPQPKQLGILDNFYAAFAACTGDYIAYCDQDDVWLPEKMAQQVAALDFGAVLVVHPSRIVDGLLRPLGRDEPGNYAHGCLPAPVDANGVRAFGHQMLFRRTVLDAMIAVRPIAERLSPGGISTSFDRFSGSADSTNLRTSAAVGIRPSRSSVSLRTRVGSSASGAAFEPEVVSPAST